MRKQGMNKQSAELIKSRNISGDILQQKARHNFPCDNLRNLEANRSEVYEILDVTEAVKQEYEIIVDQTPHNHAIIANRYINRFEHLKVSDLFLVGNKLENVSNKAVNGINLNGNQKKDVMADDHLFSTDEGAKFMSAAAKTPTLGCTSQVFKAVDNTSLKPSLVSYMS